MNPFRVDIPEADLADLRHRLSTARWPAQAGTDGWTRGVPVAELRSLAQYWAGGFDWRAAEARLNAFPQFVTEIDGQPIHFVHVRSTREDALPLLLVHGWPSTFADFTAVLADLARDHHVVVPSIPGFGFSTPVTGTWEVSRTAAAFVTLMDSLGYRRYGIQAGDVGAGIAGAMSRLTPAVTAMHVNGPSAHPFGGLSGTELTRARRFNDLVATGLGYLQLMSTKPWTIGFSLTDSPIGLLAWIFEKFHAWSTTVDHDALLTAVSIYWFTGTGATSAEFVHESMNSPGTWEAATAPTGFATFAADTGIRSLLDPGHQVEHWTEYDRGGHFPASEVPDLYVADVLEYFSAFQPGEIRG
ncbi:epoxide hydrolase family protein [Lentzea flaviverrucosa]|uniref:Pimeloyl-ACP methyl ester carboxylesterase n=1 Tax=Lentzea flaviverrucosa TaxID=200379 RepID=A0A1H9APX5_9PSEU|nr:epoxide hydrolase family protein [Lentzea flaviverrucosa]RDI31999.1 pimeloyl-ACP methyl ester carboxylesterase [Lentzea flaviverrucosa]SEP78816.1 Pimeloyl-ACP methyl ester carboxylesterase [Lentzea flaviverrucosa]